MNSIHDMGGMDGLGRINPEPEAQEPTFHADWERRVFGLSQAVGALGLWNIDISRHSRERMNPVEYLSNTYYENWFAGLKTLLLESGLLTEDELRTGKAGGEIDDELKSRVLHLEQAAGGRRGRQSSKREIDAAPRFKAGDRVRTVNRHPAGHTREPRYVRGRDGTIHEHYGAHVYPDLSSRGVDEGHHLYSVRFEASELWGESAVARGAVYLDMWEDYLETAP
jgi:nitrile hydratase